MPTPNDKLSLFQQDAIRRALDRFNEREAARRKREADAAAAARRRRAIVMFGIGVIGGVSIVAALLAWGVR